MYSSDARKAALKTFVDDLEADTRLKSHDRALLTAYKTQLDSGTSRREDTEFLGILQRFFSKIRY